MTDVQVFKWFCKEQGIMANIRGMYYVSSPKKYVRGTYKTTTLMSFNEWIHNRVGSRGFLQLMNDINSAYDYGGICCCWDNTIPNFEGMITDGFRRALKRWGYFVRNNLSIDTSTLKVGDVVFYKNPWNSHDAKCEKVVIDTINIRDGILTGHIEGTNGKSWNNKRDYITLGCLRKLDNPEEELEINYIIKRNRRVYNGVNRK